MTDIELKRCPFCGGTAKLSRRESRFSGWYSDGWAGRKGKIVDFTYQVICNRCKARGPIAVRYDCIKEEVDAGRFDPSERMKAMELWNIREMDGGESNE